MMKSFSQPRSYLFLCRLLAGLLLAAWLVPAARGDGWPYWPFKKEDKPGKPDKIVAYWNDTVLTQTGRPPIRGFGGRLMFYEGKNEEPVKVEGNLVVYAFDETDRDANNARPDRKYAFTPEQLPLHYSKTKIGHSYSVWLPWDEVGGVQKEITLIVRFQPKEGAAAISDPCRQLLPGRIEPARAKTPETPVIAVGPSFGPWRNQGNEGVQPASYQTQITDGSGILTAEWQQRRLSTTTIPLPSGSAIRSAIASPQVAPAGGGYYQAGPGPVGPAPGQNYPPQNYQPQNYQPQNYAPQNNPPRNFPPQGYAPPAPPSSVSPGLQLRTGFTPGRQWPLGEPMARLSRDRAPPQPRPAESPAGVASVPGQAPAGTAPAVPQGGQQLPN
jgi:hypothetical protein